MKKTTIIEICLIIISIVSLSIGMNLPYIEEGIYLVHSPLSNFLNTIGGICGVIAFFGGCYLLFGEKDEREYTSNYYKSRHISNSVKHQVWNRDSGRCVQCGSQERLEFDHIIPFSKGGSNTARNIQLLCENCNRKKSNNI